MDTRLIPLGSYASSNDGCIYKVVSYCGRDYRPVIISGKDNVKFYKVRAIINAYSDFIDAKLYKSLDDLRQLEGKYWKLLYDR